MIKSRKLVSLLIIIVLTILFSSVVSAVCTVSFDKTIYVSGETAIATMSCSSNSEKNTGYVLTWRDATTLSIIETDTGTTPSITSTTFTEDYDIPLTFISGNTISATLTGSQLEGHDSAVVYSALEVTTLLVTPEYDISLYINDTFLLSCNATNTGGGNLTDLLLQPQYVNGSIIGTSGGILSLNESGNYSCPTVPEDASCIHTWNITTNIKAQQDIMCYAVNEVDDVSPIITINIFENATTELGLDLNSYYYSTGESVTAKMTSYFTDADYSVIFYNSTGGMICNETGITSSTSGAEFFESCVLNDVPNQINNSVVFFINNNPNIYVDKYYEIGTVSSLDYSIVNVLLKYDETFLGYSQSIKGTVIDSYGEIAIGECCRLQIDDATTGAPIYTSEDEIIDGAGSCETHWILGKDDFVAPLSYEAMIIAWQCSDSTISSAERKRGTAVTSFYVNEYFTEINSELPVSDHELFSGFDEVELIHSRENNFGQPLEVLQTIWFANIDTEQDYHYDYLRDIPTTVNIGISHVTEKYEIPNDLPSGTYRVEKNIYYLYQGDVKEFKFVYSEDFDVIQANEVLIFNSIIVKDYFGVEITTSPALQDISSMPNSNYTNPHYLLTEGFGYQICANINNTYEENVYWHLENLIFINPMTGQSFEEFDVQSDDIWKRILSPGESEVCWSSKLPLDIETHSDWTFQFNSFVGTSLKPFSCTSNCDYSGELDYFYATAIEDTIVFEKWIEKPTNVSVGRPATYTVTAREEYMTMNDDCEYKSQEEIPWNTANVSCVAKNDPTRDLKIDYDIYPVAGEKIKICYQIKNYFSDEIDLEIYDFYLDDDSGETVVYFQGEETENYVPSITDGKVYLSEEPSRAYEQKGILEDGYANMCSKWITLPADIKGGNEWDMQGKVRINSELYNLNIPIVWNWESDEFPIYGIRDDATEYINVNTIVDSNSYKIGDELFVCANVSSLYPEQLDIEVHYNYRCSATQEDFDTDRNVYGEYTEIRSIGDTSTQNQCHKFVVPDDNYFKTQGSVYCYASTVVDIPLINERVTSSSPFFNISKHDTTMSLTSLSDNNIYLVDDFALNITIDNPFFYKQEEYYGSYDIQIQSDGSLIYIVSNDVIFHANESSKNFIISIPFNDFSEYNDNDGIGSGWTSGQRDIFLTNLQNNDKEIGIILKLDMNNAIFIEHFHNFTFKKPGTVHNTEIIGNDYSTSHEPYLYLNEYGILEYYIYFNSTITEAPDGVYSSLMRESWVTINGDDPIKRCVNFYEYTLYNNESSNQEFWLKHSCNYEDSQSFLDKDVKFFIQGRWASTPYVYEYSKVSQPIVVNSMITTESSYNGGDIIYVSANLTGYLDRKYVLSSVMYDENGFQVYEWNTDVTHYEIREGENIINFPLLLPVSIDDIPYNGNEYQIEVFLINENNKVDITERIELNVSEFNAIISENITSSTIDNNNPLTIDYVINIPTKDMMFYPNKNQPFRIKYHIINDGGQAINQFDLIDGQYAPLEAYSMFPADSTQNFSVSLQPTNLVAGTYTIIEEIQIDPPVNGVAVWETVHKGEVGEFVVTETLVGEPKGLVQTTGAIYEVSVEMNETVNEINITVNTILDIVNQVDYILEQINYTMNMDLFSIHTDLIELRVDVRNYADFNEESIFLITDSIIATQKAMETDNEEIIVKEMELVESNLKELKNSNEINYIYLLGGGLIFLILVLVIYKYSKRNVRKVSEYLEVNLKL